MTKKIIPAVIIMLVVAGGAFLGGMKYAEAHPSKADRQGRAAQFQGGNSGGRRGGFGAGGGGFSRGEILKKDEASITLKIPDGSTKIVFYGSATKIGKTVDGQATDLETGKTVLVTGSAGQDGSITAEMIQIQAPQLMPTK